MSGDSEKDKINKKKRKIGDKGKQMESECDSEVSDEYEHSELQNKMDQLENSELQNKMDQLESRMSGLSGILDKKLKVWSENFNMKMSSVIEEVMKKVMAKLDIGEPD